MKNSLYLSGGRPTWAEIRLDRLAHNYRLIQQHVGPEVQVMAMVKADAYGHGSVEVARYLEREAQADWFGVATPEEGAVLRDAGVKTPILCLSGFWPGQEADLLHYDLSTTIYRPDMLESLNQAARQAKHPANIHIKIDSGMGRLGIQPDQVVEVTHILRRCEYLTMDGVLTHFAAADDPTKDEFTHRQISTYNHVLEVFHAQGLQPKFRHLSNSAGTHGHSQARGNLVRVGGLLYGTAKDIVTPRIALLPVAPALSLHSRIILLKTVPAGQPLGYGCTFVTSRTSRIATLPIGYADGVSRAHSNCGAVLVRGTHAPIVGRVSMDLTLVDVTDTPGAEIGDVVTLIGEQEGGMVTAEEYARHVNTIALEATTTLSGRVPRYYKDEG